MERRTTTLTRATFDHLLRALDAAPERAGERYELLRQRLLLFFRSRGTADQDACADQVLNIAAARLADGEAVENVTGYCLGIARLIALEQQRTQINAEIAAREATRRTYGSSDEEDDRYERFNNCLARLSEEDRTLIIDYYAGGPDGRIKSRQRLASRLGVPMNALRIRAHRIRRQLERMMLSSTEDRR